MRTIVDKENHYRERQGCYRERRGGPRRVQLAEHCQSPSVSGQFKSWAALMRTLTRKSPRRTPTSTCFGCPGLRDRVARRAAENGRSMNTEIVEAIEHHLTRADRVTQLWELFGKHQENIEAIPVISSAIEDIEGYLEDVRSCFPEDG